MNLRIVPVTLIIGGRTGLTLWAPAWSGDGVVRYQALLGEGDKVLMFPSVVALAEYIGSDRRNDLSDHPGWLTLRSLPAEQLLPQAEDVFDLDGTYDLVSDGPNPARLAALARLVYIVGVVADCCSDAQLSGLLEQSPAFSDVETGVANYFDRVSDVAGNQRWFDLVETFHSTWEWVCVRVGSHLTWDGNIAVGTRDLTSAAAYAPTRPADPAPTASNEPGPTASNEPGPTTCPAGHIVPGGAAFCSTCGAPRQAQFH